MDDLAQRHRREGETLEQAKRAFAEQRFPDAAKTAQQVLQSQPDSVDALYIAAVVARRERQFDLAAAYLERLTALSPDLGRVLQEYGHLARDRGDMNAALSAYHRACLANPALIGSWIAIGAICAAQGRTRDATIAQAEAARLKALPPELLAAATLIHDKQLNKAENLCRRFLKANPDHPEALRLLAGLARGAGYLEDARDLLDRALARDPADPRLRIDQILLLNAEQDLSGAHAAAEAAYANDPTDPVFRLHLAVQKLNIGRFEEALALFDTAAALQPRNADTHVSRAHVLKTIGRSDEAIAAYRQAIALRPGHGEAYHALANMKTFRFQDDDVIAMQRALGAGAVPPSERALLHFALGTEHEARGEVEPAFAHFSSGNALKLQETGYDAQRMHGELARQRAACPPALFHSRADGGCPAPDPIFIVGLPRAGSTLIEQILASHSAIDGTMELQTIPALADRLDRQARRGGDTGYPEVLASLEAGSLRELGEAYLASARVHRRGAPHFIDKMPNNFRHLGLIRLILPNARIIDARRDAMDCCWSCFKQLFSQGQEFTYGQVEIGRYYRDYIELMDHWDMALGDGAVLRVQHEDVLDDLEGQVRRMLDFIGLPFEPGCLDFHRNDRAVRTASSEQVRRPINRDGVGRWRPFAEWLEPMREALGDAAASTR